MITTCTECGQLYDAGSEEQANEPERLCPACAPIYCHECSKAGGADRAIYHTAPVCKPELADKYDPRDVAALGGDPSL